MRINTENIQHLWENNVWDKHKQKTEYLNNSRTYVDVVLYKRGEE